MTPHHHPLSSVAHGGPAGEERLTDAAEICDCELPGVFCSGVPGIIARMQDGKLASDAKVERCDLCRHYPSDEAASQKLVELGLS